MRKPPLTVTPFESKTLSWWKTRATQIDMSPPYQRRGKLWSDADKAYLIDSILNGFDVPKLYMANFTYSDSPLNSLKLPYAIIDGKQRLEAIFDFFAGRITLNPDFEFLQDKSLNLGGLGYRDLRQRYPNIAEEFDNFNLSVMSVVTDDDELINQIFVRLNRSKPLTGAEIRNAMNGPVPEVIRGISNHPFFTDHIKFAVKRGEDLNAAAKLLLFEFMEVPQDTKKSRLDSFVLEAAEDRAQLELSARRLNDVLNDMTSVFLPQDRLLASAGVVPVYYWFVRGLPAAQLPYVREFLVRFEEERRANRRRADAQPEGEVDREFVEYDNFNRNTNDIGSHVGRIEILTRKFSEYLETARQEIFSL